MQGPFLRKYGVQTTIDFQLFEIDGVDFRVDAAHAAGDTKIMKDEGAEANTSNGFTDEGQGYSIVLDATEMQAARIVVYIVDQGAKVWLDTSIVIDTYGNASAMHAIDLDDGVRAGLTALPNAAADAAGGLPISDAGGLDLDSLLADATADIMLTGTASAGSSTTITLTGGVATDNYYAGQLVVIIGGTGVGQSRTILSYIGATTVATVTRDWAVATDASSEFMIIANDVPAILEAGTAQAGGAATITLDTNASATTDIYKNNYIMITAGVGIGQTRLIGAYNGGTKVVTVIPNWTTNPDNTSVYQILPAARVDVGGWAGALVTLSSNNRPDVNIAEISDDETAPGNLELDYDGTGYDKANSTIGNTTTNADMRGTNNAATEAKQDVIDGIVDDILVDTATTIPALIAALENLSAADIATELATYDSPTKAEMDSAHALLATVAKQDVIDGIVDAILVDTGTTIPGLIAALNDPTAAAIATAVMAKTVDGTIDVTEALTVILAMAAGDIAKSSNTYTYDDQSGTVKLTEVVSASAVARTIA
jgi:hypothetical protein